MVFNNDGQQKSWSLHQKQTFQQKITRLKEELFTAINAHLVQNQNATPFHYYLIVLIEHVSLLWYFLHPGLNVYGDVYLINELRNVLRVLNFQEYLYGNSNVYQVAVGIILAHIFFQVAMIIISVKSISNHSHRMFAKYLKKIVNLQLIFTTKVLSGPIIAITVNVFYCNQSSPYWIGETCYDNTHLVFCVLSALILIIILAQILLVGCLYFNKNPLNKSFMGDKSRLYTLSKALIKIFLPIYFTVDYFQDLSVVYLFLLAALWGVYIFWHRLLSTHSYQQQHFYFEYYLQSFLFWIAINNILSHYIEGPNTMLPMSLCYSFFTAMLISVLIINFQKSAEIWLFQQCLERKVKKQNMQRFVFILIHLFLNEPPKKSKINFKVYSKLIMKNTEKFEANKNILQANEYKSEEDEIYSFLYILVSCYLQDYNSFILSVLKCYLLSGLDKKCFALHQALELEQQKLSFTDQYMLFAFRTNLQIFKSETAGKISRQFIQCYRFHEELDKFEDYIDECAHNNSEYWDELCEGDPSLPKLRSLATNYSKFSQLIVDQYKKVIEMSPQNIYSTGIYMNFLMNVGVDTLEAVKVKEKLLSILESRSRSVSISSFRFSEDEDMAILTVNSIGHDLGVIMNCNINIKETLGYDKTNLIGKNVGRIMPKFFGEIHNQFVLRFIKSEVSHLRPSEKVVTALNKDSQIVEMKLTVGVMTTSENALVIVGFMKALTRQPEQKDNGFLIFSINTLDILGIDAKFQKMINHKITGRQICQEELKLTAIFPQVNPELFEISMCVKTTLEIGKTESQQLGLQVKKIVKIELKEINHFQGISVGLLYVSEELSREKSYHSLSEMRNQPVLKLAKALSPDVLSFLNIRKKGRERLATVVKDQVSISVSENQLPRKNDGIGKQLIIAKKIEQCLTDRSSTSENKMIVLIHLLYFLGIAFLLTFCYLSHKAQLSQINMMYGQMNQINSMPYYVSRVSLLSSLIWSIKSKAPQPNYKRWLSDYSADYESLKINLAQIVIKTKQYPVNLQYNALNNYTFSYVAAVNTYLVTFSFTAPALSIFACLEASAAIYLVIDPAELKEKDIFQIQTLFITLNGGGVLVNITNNAMILYRDYANTVVQDQFLRMIWLKLCIFCVGVATIIFIMAVTRRINGINQEVFAIYHDIRLWDISELSCKCNNFLRAKGSKIPKRRQSSLRRIFPNKTLLAIITHQIQKEHSSNHRPALNSSLQSRPHALLQPLSVDPILTPAPKSQMERIDNEEALLNSQQVEQTVHIEWNEDYKCVMMAIIMLIVIICGVVGVSIYVMNKNMTQLQDEIIVLQKVGQIRSALSFINYYSYLILQNQTNQSIRKSLNSQILKFYQLSGQVYPFISSQLKIVYTYIETIQQWLALPNISSSNILLANYQTIYSALLNASLDLEKIYETDFQPNFDSIISNDKYDEIIFTFTLLGISILLILVVNCLYLRPVSVKSKQCLNMIKILPAWIFRRNGRALQRLTQ